VVVEKTGGQGIALTIVLSIEMMPIGISDVILAEVTTTAPTPIGVVVADAMMTETAVIVAVAEAAATVEEEVWAAVAAHGDVE
jgi:hypothetical protein